MENARVGGVRLVLVLFLSLVALLLSIVLLVRLAASPFWFNTGLGNGTVHILTADGGSGVSTDRSRASSRTSTVSREMDALCAVLFAASLRARQLPGSVQIGESPSPKASIALKAQALSGGHKPAFNLFHIASAPFHKMPSTRSSPSRLKSRFFVTRIFLVVRHPPFVSSSPTTSPTTSPITSLPSCPPLLQPRYPDLVSKPLVTVTSTM